MIEKLIPIGFTLVVLGAIGFIIEYYLFSTPYMIVVAYFGLLLSTIPFAFILSRKGSE